MDKGRDWMISLTEMRPRSTRRSQHHGAWQRIQWRHPLSEEGVVPQDMRADATKPLAILRRPRDGVTEWIGSVG
jgi:hypothetical protein